MDNSYQSEFQGTAANTLPGPTVFNHSKLDTGFLELAHTTEWEQIIKFSEIESWLLKSLLKIKLYKLPTKEIILKQR